MRNRKEFSALPKKPVARARSPSRRRARPTRRGGLRLCASCSAGSLPRRAFPRARDCPACVRPALCLLFHPQGSLDAFRGPLSRSGLSCPRFESAAAHRAAGCPVRVLVSRRRAASRLPPRVPPPPSGGPCCPRSVPAAQRAVSPAFCVRRAPCSGSPPPRPRSAPLRRALPCARACPACVRPALRLLPCRPRARLTRSAGRLRTEGRSVRVPPPPPGAAPVARSRCAPPSGAAPSASRPPVRVPPPMSAAPRCPRSAFVEHHAAPPRVLRPCPPSRRASAMRSRSVSRRRAADCLARVPPSSCSVPFHPRACVRRVPQEPLLHLPRACFSCGRSIVSRETM